MRKTFKPCQKIQKPDLRNKTREIHWQEIAKANYHDIFTGKKPQMAGVIVTEKFKLEPKQKYHFSAVRLAKDQEV